MDYAEAVSLAMNYNQYSGLGSTFPDRLRPAALRQLLADFEASEPLVEVWKRVPNVKDGEDDPACDTMSARFTAFARSKGFESVALACWYDQHPFADFHCYSTVTVDTLTFRVDWTARQFHNWDHEQDGPTYNPVIDVSNLPCPMVWTNGPHPVLGEFSSQVVLEHIALGDDVPSGYALCQYLELKRRATLNVGT